MVENFCVLVTFSALLCRQNPIWYWTKVEPDAPLVPRGTGKTKRSAQHLFSPRCSTWNLFARLGVRVRLIAESRKKVRVDFPNAFIGRKTQPPQRTLQPHSASHLVPGKSSPAGWQAKTSPQRNGTRFRPSTAGRSGRSSSPETSSTWARVPAVSARLLFWETALLWRRAQANLPKPILQEIAGSKRYAEGTGVRLLVKSSEDLPSVRTLIEIKLQN